LRENRSRLTPFGGSVDLNRSQATADYPVSIQMKSHHGIDEEVRQMTMTEILGSAIGAILVVAAVAYIRRSRKNSDPIELAVDKKLRP
jgi:hypothetical protein